ncbi:MAG TPA: FMN-binding protein [Clostridiales bacterium]|nr:FMN-binding protein [Clostridiales bacterium]
MKKSLLALILMFVFIFALAGCQNNQQGSNASGKLKDGTYSATAPDFNAQGYKPTVEVVIKDGKVISVSIDEIKEDGSTKKALSESGQYKMVELGGAQAEWHEQVALYEKAVVEQGVENVKLNDKGAPDAISGCTITVSDYAELIKEAINKAK